MNESSNAVMIVQAQKRPREIRVPADDVVRGLIAEVHQSLTTKQRLGMLRRIQNELFLKNDQGMTTDLINWFLELGGFRVLLLQLGLVLDRQGSTVHEIHGLCQCMHELLRKSTNDVRETIMEALEENNALDLFERACREWDTPQIPFIAHWISACTRGTHLLWQSPSLLRRMTTLLQSQQMHQHLEEVLGFFKNVTYFDRQGRLMGESGFVLHLTALSLQPNHHPERISAIWRNLALIHECRDRLKQSVNMLQILYTLATAAHTEHGHDDETHVHRNVLNTTINLCMDQEYCLSFLLYGDGLYTALLERLLMSDDSTTRKRAARTLRLWAAHGSSANLLVQASSLMGTLSAIAVRDDNDEVRREAAEAFGRCAGWIQSPMPQHRAVLQALTQLCRTAPPAIVARAIRGQTALPNNRSVLSDNPMLVESLVTIASKPEAGSLVREDACTALLHLISVPSNRSKLFNKRLLDALSLNLQAIPVAGEIVIQLAKEEALTAMLVQHDQLIKALIRCAAQPDHPFKHELKQIVLRLVEAL